MIEKLDNSIFYNDDIIFGDKESDIVTFFSNNVNLSCISLDNVNLDDDNLENCDPKTINHVRLMSRYNSYTQHETCKKS